MQYHYKSLQHYMIISNKQYNITPYFCKFLKRNTDTLSAPMSPSNSFFGKQTSTMASIRQLPNKQSTTFGRLMITRTPRKLQNRRSHLGPSILNIEYGRYISWQNYIPDNGYGVIYLDMVLNTGCHFRRHIRWRIYMWLPI